MGFYCETCLTLSLSVMDSGIGPTFPLLAAQRTDYNYSRRRGKGSCGAPFIAPHRLPLVPTLTLSLFFFSAVTSTTTRICMYACIRSSHLVALQIF